MVILRHDKLCVAGLAKKLAGGGSFRIDDNKNLTALGSHLVMPESQGINILADSSGCWISASSFSCTSILLPTAVFRASTAEADVNPAFRTSSEVKC